MPNNLISKTLKIYKNLEEFRREYCFTYIDVGARWGANTGLLSLFSNSRWVGFEPDPEEFKKIESSKKKGQEYLPFALGASSGIKDLNITKSPDWSSLYDPDPEMFRQFKGLNNFYPITSKCQIPIRALDDLVKSCKDTLGNADYLKIDVQGAEVDVLKGASNLISKSIIAVEVEVEFVQLYKGQPLFGQIHDMLINNGFLLFDLSRNRCIRSDFSSNIETRGQLIWSDALYLKDYHKLIADACYEKLLALSLTALKLGFPDYFSTILKAMIENNMVDKSMEEGIEKALKEFKRKQRHETYCVDLISIFPFGKKLLRYLRKIIDNSIDRIITLAHPEYYFRRD